MIVHAQPAAKKFIFYLQYPHFFHIRISQITFMISTVDTKHQLLINNHFHILNAGMPNRRNRVALPHGRVPPKANYLFSFSYKAGVP